MMRIFQNGILKSGFRRFSNIELLKKLREATASPISDCKEALDQNAQNLEKAIEWLQKKGLQIKDNAGSNAGLIAMNHAAPFLSAIQLNCSSEFASLSREFRDACKIILSTLQIFPKSEINLSNKDIFMNYKVLDSRGKFNNKTILEICESVSRSLNENVRLTNMMKRTMEKDSSFGKYLHGISEDIFGTKAGFVKIKTSEAAASQISNLTDQIAMHIVAMKPKYISKSQLSQEDLLLAGSNSEYLKKISLLDQEFILSKEKKTVNQILIEKSYELKANLNVSDMSYWDSTIIPK